MTNEEMVEKIQAGERELIPELWERVRRFVAMKAAQRYALTGGAGGAELDDLIQSGYLALCEAVGYFVPDGEYKFLTYLSKCLYTAFLEAEGRRSEKQVRDPLHKAMSLDVPLGDDPDGDTLGDIQADTVDQIEAAERRIWLEQLREAVSAALKDLPEDQRAVLHRRYWNGHTYRELASEAGVTPVEIHKRENKALRTLRMEKYKNGLDAFEEERHRAYIDERTPWYMQVGVAGFNSTGASAVERIAEIRERLGSDMDASG